MKRLFDLAMSFFAICFLSPLFIVVALLISLDSRGGVFFHQIRVGKNGKHFKLHKFRTMRPNAESSGQLTVGNKDNRITRTGVWIRKYKIDELPQLFNILKGEMSIVGPRPEVPKYVALYTKEQKQVLNVRPGLTDYASIDFIDENAILEKAENPEEAYIQEIMPMKLKLNIKYISEMSFATDLKIILGTLKAIFSR